jgi:hypothetical protein
MSAIPGNLDTDQQPPVTVPLRHFAVGLCVFISNLLLVVRRHSPQPLDRIVLGRFSPRRVHAQQSTAAADESVEDHG